MANIIIRPGGMGKASDPQGIRPSAFANSMADAMDTAFHTLLSAELSAEFMKTVEVDTNSKAARDRRRLFVAIAQGVVRHLKDNAGALVIEDSANNKVNLHINIQVDNTLI